MSTSSKSCDGFPDELGAAVDHVDSTAQGVAAMGGATNALISQVQSNDPSVATIEVRSAHAAR